MESKNRFRDIKLGGRGGPIFIDALSKLWPSDQKYFGHSGLRHAISQQYAVWPRGLNSNTVWPDLNSDAVWLKIIMCNACTVRVIFGPLTCCHVTVQQCIRIFSNRIVTPHQSMQHHRSMPHHQSVYMNSVVNSNIDNIVHVNVTVHVNRDIFPFYAPPKVFDCPEFKSDVCFAVWFLVHCEMTMIPLKYIKYLIKIKHA